MVQKQTARKYKIKKKTTPQKQMKLIQQTVLQPKITQKNIQTILVPGMAFML